MRRKEREVKNFEKIISVISKCSCCRIGFYDSENDEVYIVPMNFGFLVDGNREISLYFHGASKGRKYEFIKKRPVVGFEMDTDYKCVGETKACSYTAKYISIIGNGIIEEVESTDEKICGLKLLMKQSTGKDDWNFSDESIENVSVFKLSVKSFSCKENI